jgi:lipoate-protein ligase A
LAVARPLELISEVQTLDPEENLRREDNYMRSGQGRAARVWRNSDCVVLGRFLVAEREVDLVTASALGIPVLRRSSGGGAVFHDTGNINYSLYLDTADIVSWRVEDALRELSWPVTSLLDKLDVPWTWVPPNNIYVLGRKISGSSQVRQGCRILHHGTFLVETDLDRMQRVLKEGGRSRHAPVINLNEVVSGATVERVVESLAAIISADSLGSAQAGIAACLAV